MNSYLSGGLGVLLLLVAQSAVHEIEAGIPCMIATISLVGAGILNALQINRAITWEAMRQGGVLIEEYRKLKKVLQPEE